MRHDYFHPFNWTKEESYDQEPFNNNVSTVNENMQTQESVVVNMNDRGEIRFRLDKGEAVAELSAEATTKPKATKKGAKRKVAAATGEIPLRIYHKNIERSERIFNQKIKKSGFIPDGEGQPR
nr:chloramphenicol acetyltransferase-like domain-containing protein [Tanacetum cinerariifolium]